MDGLIADTQIFDLYQSVYVDFAVYSILIFFALLIGLQVVGWIGKFFFGLIRKN